MIDKIKQMIDELAMNTYGKIGVAITEHNRPEVFAKSLEEIKRFLPPGAILVVVDDASTVPVKGATFRFEKNVGIAAAKNKCIELLYNQGCEHFFLFDSDTYPVKENWHVPYIECDEPHLNYIFQDFAGAKKLNDTKIVYSDDRKVAYSHPRGCMLYYSRLVFDKVGGMDPEFGRWGFEHGNLSDRIHMAGLTSFRYMDVIDSNRLIMSLDEHQKVTTTVSVAERKPLLEKNEPKYIAKKFSKEYIPFAKKQNVIITTYLAGILDSQRGKPWEANIEELSPLISSVKETKLIVLHNCLDLPNTPKVEFVRVSTSVNPYIQRWISIREFLVKNRHLYDNVFCVDATDVEILREPDWSQVHRGLFVGDEDQVIGCEWMIKQHQNATLQNFFQEFANHQLLNCGVVGASVETIIELTRQMIDFCSLENGISLMDMGVLNYIVYTNWREKVRTGRQITTLFKGFEKNNKVSWFRHK